MPPKYNCKVGQPREDGYELGAHRDRIGNITFAFWKCGVGFRDEVQVSLREAERLRDWLTKVIEHVKRP